MKILPTPSPVCRIDSPVMVTGANGGIGFQIARRLAALRVPLILTCRSEAKGEAVVEALKREFDGIAARAFPLDLSDSQSVRRFAAKVDGTPLYGLINNAGVMNRSFHIGPDGKEDTLNVNYYNTRLLTELLLPCVVPGGAVVFTTSVTRLSGGHDNLPLEVTEETFSQLGTYALSKKLITRYAARLARDERWSVIRINCADPGVVNSGMITMHRWYDPLADIFFRPFIRSAENGSLPALRALLTPLSARIFTLRRSHPL